MAIQCDNVVVLQNTQGLSIFSLVEILALSDETLPCFLYQEVVEISVFQTLSADFVSIVILDLFDEITNSPKSLL